MRNKLAVLLLLVLTAISVNVILTPTTEQSVQAQFIDIDVDGQIQRIIGEEPVYTDHGVFSVHRQWLARSLAVYLDGKRLRHGVDYHPNVRNFEIHIRAATPHSNVVIDYTPR